MPTTREVDAAKQSRQLRDRRYYTVDLLGPLCNDANCGLRLPTALVAAGFTVHPTCGRANRDIMELRT